jgi:hypothetical protein
VNGERGRPERVHVTHATEARRGELQLPFRAGAVEAHGAREELETVSGHAAAQLVRAVRRRPDARLALDRLEGVLGALELARELGLPRRGHDLARRFFARARARGRSRNEEGQEGDERSGIHDGNLERGHSPAPRRRPFPPHPGSPSRIARKTGLLPGCSVKGGESYSRAAGPDRRSGSKRATTQAPKVVRPRPRRTCTRSQIRARTNYACSQRSVDRGSSPDRWQSSPDPTVRSAG